MSRKGLLGLWVVSVAVSVGAIRWNTAHYAADAASPFLTAVMVVALLACLLLTFLVIVCGMAELTVHFIGTGWLSRLTGTPFAALLWDELRPDRRNRR
ncbi:MAG: hypothetical protein DI589_11450 [Shinella sp.]|nr:MAG: hypothetical protein DI589_11450 [Shinella sp.]